MSRATRERRAEAKQDRADLLRGDDKGGDEHRRAAAHAHVMTHHALEMDTASAHRAAAEAHTGVAEMHGTAADDLEEEEAPDSSERVPAPKKK